MIRRSLAAIAVLAALAVLAAGCTSSSGVDAVPGGSSLPPSSTPSATVIVPGPDRWRGTIVSRTFHDLYVGGTCVSGWRTTLRFRVRDGRVTGRGRSVRTSGGAPCPFPVAQLQVRSFRLSVTGTLRGRELELRLRERSATPAAGADDLGGFRATTLATMLRLRVGRGAVGQVLRLRRPDGDRGSYGSSNVIHLACRSC